MNGSFFKNDVDISYVDISYGNHSFLYQRYRNDDLKQIKKLIKENPNEEIYYGNNWIRIAGETFNGFSKKFIEKYCNIANKRV